jgi:hypothetical protein
MNYLIFLPSDYQLPACCTIDFSALTLSTLLDNVIYNWVTLTDFALYASANIFGAYAISGSWAIWTACGCSIGTKLIWAIRHWQLPRSEDEDLTETTPNEKTHLLASP